MRVFEKFQIGKRMVYDKMSFRELIIAFFAHWTGYASGGRKSGTSGNPTAQRLENYLCEHYEEWTRGGFGDDLEQKLIEKVMKIEEKYGTIEYASAYNIGRRIRKAWPEIEEFLETTKLINDKAEYRYMSREQFLNMFKDIGEARTISYSELKSMLEEGSNFYVWTISEMRDTGYGMENWEMVEGSEVNFSSADEAYENGLRELKGYTTGDYCLEVWDNKTNYLEDRYAEIHNGEVSEY